MQNIQNVLEHCKIDKMYGRATAKKQKKKRLQIYDEDCS